MTDYSKTKIYKIESHLGDKVYVGSTAKQYLSQRFQQHKNSYKSWKKGIGYKITSYDLFDEYGIENCQIVLLEEYPCSSKDAKNAREGFFIKELNCVNKQIMGQTLEEYRKSERGKERITKYQQSEKGKEALKEAMKKYQESEHGKEKIKNVLTNYYRANKEVILEKKKVIYQQKKAKKLEEANKSELIII